MELLKRIGAANLSKTARRKDETDELKLFSVVRPVIKALRYNIEFVSFGLLMTIALMLAQIPFEKLSFPRPVLPDGQVSMPPWPLLIFIPFYLAGIFISIFVILVLADGAHREKESLTTYVRQGVRIFLRVLFSYIVAGLAIILPIIGAAIIIGACLAVATVSGIQALQVIGAILAFVSGLSAFIWLVVISIRYSLVGLVAMFEPHVPILATRKRSRQLLKGPGAWLVFKLGLLSMLATSVILLPFYIHMFSIITAQTPQIQPPAYLQNYLRLSNLMFAVLNIFFTAMLVVLYLNRRSKWPEFRAFRSNRQNLKMIVFGALVACGAVTLSFSIPPLKRRYNLQQQQIQLQQAAQQQAEIETALTVYASKHNNYALKLPPDFVLNGTDPNFGEKYVSSAEVTPFVVMAKTLPRDPKLVYAGSNTANDALETSILVSLDNKLQELAGSSDVITVAAGAHIPGTSHKRALFARGHVTDNDGQSLTMRVAFVPKNDGTALMVTVLGLAAHEQQNDPVIDFIFKSIDLRHVKN
jgi:hypothetical protein